MQDRSQAPYDNLQVATHSIGGIVVLSVRGELDVITAPRLTEAIESAIHQAETAVVIDYSKLAFMASVGVKLLVTADEAAADVAKRVVVVAHGPITSRPLQLMGPP